MKFLHREIHAFEDAQRNFEQLEGKDILDASRESVLQMAVTGTQRVSAWGNVSIVFPSSQTATALVVTHGLGVTPQVVFIQPQGGAFAGNMTFYVGTFTSTQFTVNGFCSVVANFSSTLYWLAIG